MNPWCNPPILQYSELFDVIYKRNILSFQCKMWLHWYMSTREINGCSLVFSDCNAPDGTPRLYVTWRRGAASSKYDLPCCQFRIYRYHPQRGLNMYLVFVEATTYIQIILHGWGGGRCRNPACISLGVNNSPSVETLNFLPSKKWDNALD